MKKLSELIREGCKDTRPAYRWQGRRDNMCCAHGAAHLAATGEWEKRDLEVDRALRQHPEGYGLENPFGAFSLESWINHEYIKGRGRDPQDQRDIRLIIADMLEKAGL